jgi:hypothetical protein
LKRDTDRKQPKSGSFEREKTATIGGLNGVKSLEATPAIEELEMRLGVVKSRGETHALDVKDSPNKMRLSKETYSTTKDNRTHPMKNDPVPPTRAKDGLQPSEDAIEEMKHRFLRGRSSSSISTTPASTREQRLSWEEHPPVTSSSTRHQSTTTSGLPSLKADR